MSVNYPMTALNVGGFYPSHAINGGKMRYNKVCDVLSSYYIW